MSRVIEVVEYDPNWITTFKKEAAILTAVFGERLLDLDHIGSTAVPGLCSKPIIDILVVLDDTDDISSYNPAIRARTAFCAAIILSKASLGHITYISSRLKARDGETTCSFVTTSSRIQRQHGNMQG
jgi:GrpB-like predicted nucleotidyltransferase (UPF0157 family)